jgi:hypothetical protein
MKIQPPMRLSPPAGLFVCSLLRREPAHRLGTCCSVTTAPYFQSINWSKLARLEYETFFTFDYRSRSRMHSRSESFEVNVDTPLADSKLEDKNDSQRIKDRISSSRIDSGGSDGLENATDEKSKGVKKIATVKQKKKVQLFQIRGGGDTAKALEAYQTLSDELEIRQLRGSSTSGSCNSGSSTNGSGSGSGGGGGGGGASVDEDEYWTLGLDEVLTHPPIISDEDMNRFSLLQLAINGTVI